MLKALKGIHATLLFNVPSPCTPTYGLQRFCAKHDAEARQRHGDDGLKLDIQW